MLVVNYKLKLDQAQANPLNLILKKSLVHLFNKFTFKISSLNNFH